MDEFYKKLFELFEAGNQAETEKFLIEQTYAYDDVRVIVPTNELGSFYRGLGRFEEANQNYEKALTFITLFNLERTPQHQAVLVNQATLMRLTKEYEDSVDQFREVLSMADPDSYIYVSVLNNLAITYIEMNELTTAATLLGAAMDWHTKHGSAAHEIGVTGINLASVFIKAGDYKKAQEALNRAFAALDSQDWVDEHYAAGLAAQAVLCKARGDLEGAKLNYRRAMELTEKFFGRNPEYEKAKHALEKLEDNGE